MRVCRCNNDEEEKGTNNDGFSGPNLCAAYALVAEITDDLLMMTRCHVSQRCLTALGEIWNGEKGQGESDEDDVHGLGNVCVCVCVWWWCWRR